MLNVYGQRSNLQKRRENSKKTFCGLGMLWLASIAFELIRSLNITWWKKSSDTFGVFVPGASLQSSQIFARLSENAVARGLLKRGHNAVSVTLRSRRVILIFVVNPNRSLLEIAPKSCSPRRTEDSSAMSNWRVIWFSYYLLYCLSSFYVAMISGQQENGGLLRFSKTRSVSSVLIPGSWANHA